MYRYRDGQIYDVKTGQTVAITYAATPKQGACFAAAPQMLAALEALIEAAVGTPPPHVSDHLKSVVRPAKTRTLA